MAALLPAAEAGDSAAAPPQCRPPPAGGLYVQPAGPTAAPLPSGLHQALHCAPGPAGSHRQSCAAALDAPAGRDADLVDGGGRLGDEDGPHEGFRVVEGGYGPVLSAAA